jgi:hypothetical protein
MALLRRLAISILNQETSKKRRLKQKATRASMSPDYRLTVLAADLATQHNFSMLFLRLPWYTGRAIRFLCQSQFHEQAIQGSWLITHGFLNTPPD